MKQIIYLHSSLRYFLNYRDESKINTALLNKDNGEIRRGRNAASLGAADAHKWGFIRKRLG